MNSKGNKDTLRKPFTQEEAKEYGRKGGIKSGEAKRKKKLIRETLEIILNQKIRDPEMRETLKHLGFKGVPTYCDYLTAMIVTRTAEKGTMSDLEKLAVLLGENEDPGDPAVLIEAKKILDNIPSVID